MGRQQHLPCRGFCPAKSCSRILRAFLHAERGDFFFARHMLRGCWRIEDMWRCALLLRCAHVKSNRYHLFNGQPGHYKDMPPLPCDCICCCSVVVGEGESRPLGIGRRFDAHQEGHLEVLQWARERGCPIDPFYFKNKTKQNKLMKTKQITCINQVTSNYRRGLSLLHSPEEDDGKFLGHEAIRCPWVLQMKHLAGGGFEGQSRAQCPT